MPHDNQNEKMDQLMLQRLVDNELSHDQIRQLLAEAEFGEDVAKWKQIALAFTENQMFDRAFHQKESTVGDTSTVVELTRQSVPGQAQMTAQSVVGRNRSTNNFWRAAALAASLLLAVVLYQASNTSPKVGNDLLVHSPSTIDPPAAVVEPKSIKSFDRMTLASYEPDHQLKAEDIDSASIGKHNSSIPLYDIERLNPEQLANLRGDDRAAREAMFSQVLPKSFSLEVVQQLEQSGGMVDQNLEFISGRLDDGRSYLIPYRTIRFLPGQ